MRFEQLTEKLVEDIEPWFDDAETRRYLGGRDWVKQSIFLIQKTRDVEFKGHVVSARHIWIVFDDENRPIALVDLELYNDETAAIAFVVAPHVRNQGVGLQVLQALTKRHELKNTRAIIGGVEPENKASRACLTKAGFLISEKIDEEGMLLIEMKLHN